MLLMIIKIMKNPLIMTAARMGTYKFRFGNRKINMVFYRTEEP